MEPYPYSPHPYQRRPNAFAAASVIFGVISLLSCLIIYITVFFGCLSILFALLSRQESLKMPSSSQAGCVLSSVAIAMSAILTAISFAYLIYLFGLETVLNPDELLEKYRDYVYSLGGMMQ